MPYTGYWISDNHIYGPHGESTGYWIGDEDHIYGIRGFTGFYIRANTIYSVSGATKYYVREQDIYGPSKALPWKSS